MSNLEMVICVVMSTAAVVLISYVIANIVATKAIKDYEAERRKKPIDHINIRV
jgi:hypothetical protein